MTTSQRYKQESVSVPYLLCSQRQVSSLALRISFLATLCVSPPTTVLQSPLIWRQAENFPPLFWELFLLSSLFLFSIQLVSSFLLCLLLFQMKFGRDISSRWQLQITDAFNAMGLVSWCHLNTNDLQTVICESLPDSIAILNSIKTYNGVCVALYWCIKIKQYFTFKYKLVII